MNEKLVSWFEELLPEIKKSGNVKDTMLKFANKKNLAPALLEKLGHVYNTAKTVTYLDKCASEEKGRGETFDVLDVPKMVVVYTEKKAGDHEYENNDYSSLSSGRFSDLFEKEIDLNDFNSLESIDDYQEIKMASDRRQSWKKASVALANEQQADQLIFDMVEDNRKLASEISDHIRDSYNETNYTNLEQDAKYYFGDCVKEACDYLAGYMTGIGYPVSRAEDKGPRRLLDDTSLLTKLASIQDNLNGKHMAEDFKEDYLKKQAIVLDHLGRPVSEKKKKKKPKKKSGDPVDKRVSEFDLDASEIADAQWDASYPDAELPGIREEIGLERMEGALKEDGRNLLNTIPSALHGVRRGLGAGGSFPQALEKMHAKGKDFLSLIAPKRNTEQELIDRELDEAKYVTLIQDLLITDPILSEEDEDKVVDLYNTVKEVAPELAKDKNVMRVVLRSAVQYDGIAAPDLAQLVEAEKTLQKSKWNTQAVQERSYEGSKGPDGMRIAP